MKTWIVAGAGLAGLAVVLGAFGAHGLKTKVSPDLLEIFETGVRYHLFHAVGLILLGLLGFHYSPDVVHLPAILFATGILLFSGSLYLLVLTGLRWLGAVTPIGGLAFIAGWILLVVKILRT